METAQSHNSRLTGAYISPEPDQINNIHSQTEQKNATNETNPNRKEETGTGISRRNLRIKLAREVWAELKRTAAEDREKRIELIKLIEKLTAGRIKKKPKSSAFD